MPSVPTISMPPTQELPIEQLVAWDDNPRRINPAALARLYMSVDEYGFLQQVVYNQRTGHIVAGHQRVEVLRQHGVQRVPCVVVDWDEDKEAAGSIALNAPFGEFIPESLRERLSDLVAHEYDIDLTALPPFLIEDTLATQDALDALEVSSRADAGSLLSSSPLSGEEEAALAPSAASSSSSSLAGAAGRLFGATLQIGHKCGPGAVCPALALVIADHIAQGACSRDHQHTPEKRRGHQSTQD